MKNTFHKNSFYRRESTWRIWSSVRKILTPLHDGPSGFIFLLVVFLSSVAFANPLPKTEVQVIEKVAQEYNLTRESKKLLYVIRIVENGETPKEFGVLTPEAMRFQDSKKSFITQARWAAGTISKRFNGDLEAFAARWCPVNAENDPNDLNKNWLPNATYWMKNIDNEK